MDEIVGKLAPNKLSTYCALSLVSKDMRVIVDTHMFRDLPFLPPPTLREAVKVLLTPGSISGCPDDIPVPRSILLLQTLKGRPEVLVRVRSFSAVSNVLPI